MKTMMIGHMALSQPMEKSGKNVLYI
jgi:hypothetical protein